MGGVRAVAGLPHRDPFDRMLVAQAAVEGFVLVTADDVLLGAELAGIAVRTPVPDRPQVPQKVM